MADIVVLGGCIIDLISYAPRFPKPGETLAGTKFLKGFGGKGANQCVMTDRLGAKTALIAKLGNDTFGKEYFEDLKKSNIISDFVTIDENSQTSTAAITVTDEGQNNIIFTPGAILKLTPNDVKAAENLIAKAQILLCTFETPLDALLEALMIAKKHKLITVVNAAPVFDQKYDGIYPFVDVICMNEVEAEDLTSIKVESENDATMAIALMQKKGCTDVIITLGSKGAAFKEKENPKLFLIAAKNVVSVDSTGAGDAFMGSLVYFMAKHPNLPLKEKVYRSCHIATMSVLKNGTQTSFPFLADIPEEIMSLTGCHDICDMVAS